MAQKGVSTNLVHEDGAERGLRAVLDRLGDGLAEEDHLRLLRGVVEVLELALGTLRHDELVVSCAFWKDDLWEARLSVDIGWEEECRTSPSGFVRGRAPSCSS